MKPRKYKFSQVLDQREEQAELLSNSAGSKWGTLFLCCCWK